MRDVERRRARVTKDKVNQHYGDKARKMFTDWREALEMNDLDALDEAVKEWEEEFGKVN